MMWCSLECFLFVYFCFGQKWVVERERDRTIYVKNWKKWTIQSKKDRLQVFIRDQKLFFSKQPRTLKLYIACPVFSSSSTSKRCTKRQTTNKIPENCQLFWEKLLVFFKYTAIRKEHNFSFHSCEICSSKNVDRTLDGFIELGEINYIHNSCRNAHTQMHTSIWGPFQHEDILKTVIKSNLNTVKPI